MSRAFALFVVLLSAAFATNPGGFPNSLGRTPSRGWNTWNGFRQDPSYNQALLAGVVEGLLAPIPGLGYSLRDAGYNFTLLDQGWEACGSGVGGSYHDAQGRPLVNTTRLPDLAGLIAQSRAKGVDTHWYFNGCEDSACTQAESKLPPHYETDVAALIAHGFAGLKVDACGNSPNISLWAEALYATGEQIILENCNDGSPQFATAAQCPYNYFRTSSDHAPFFANTIANAMDAARFLPVSRPGCFASADMSAIGTPAYSASLDGFPNTANGCGGRRLTVAEARAEMAMWSTLSSPLVIGFDTRNATELATWGPIVAHAGALAVQAAWAGEAGRVVALSNETWSGSIPIGCYCEAAKDATLPLWGVFGKRLNASSIAAVVFAGGWRGAADFSAPLAAMGFPPGATVSSADVWTGADMGDVSGAWQGSVEAPGGDWRIFTLKMAPAGPGAGFLLSSAAAAAAVAAASAVGAERLGRPTVRAANKTLIVPLATPPLMLAGLTPPPARGLFDPSLAASGDSSVPLLMSLSAVEATDDIATRIAGFDAGRSEWVLLARVNEADRSDALPCAGAPCAGSVVREVSSLVIDAADPDPSRRLKVFAHSYIVTNGTELHYDWGRISLFTAPSAVGPWSAEQPLLGWRGASPYSSDGVRQVLTDLPPLADCLLFTEPGALALGGAQPLLLLALGCASPPAETGGTAPIRVELLASADFGTSWAHVAELVGGAADTAALGSTVPQINAADLFVAADATSEPAIFLSVTPSRLLWPGFVGYAGCVVLQLAANASGVLRDAAGRPIVVRAIEPDGLAFSGACTAAGAGVPANAESAGGYMLPALIPVPPADFRVLPSGLAPL